MVVRDTAGRRDDAGGHDGSGCRLEVLMLRRSLRSSFVGGAYVFPGGSLEPADASDDVLVRCRGRGEAEARALLGVATGGLAYWVAAVRECFEEAGLLLAGGPGSSVTADGLLSFADEATGARFVDHRRALNAHELTFLELCDREDLSLLTDRLHYFAHWITPVGLPRRFDTRFFVAAAPQEQEARHDANETIAAIWITPHDALRRHRAGEIELIFPTIRNLEAIGRFATSAELLAAARHAEHVPLVEPRVVVDGGGVRILLPQDPGYADASPPAAPL